MERELGKPGERRAIYMKRLDNAGRIWSVAKRQQHSSGACLNLNTTTGCAGAGWRSLATHSFVTRPSAPQVTPTQLQGGAVRFVVQPRMGQVILVSQSMVGSRWPSSQQPG